ncbi:MAG: hypothetical protein Ct9H300mP8_07570 [Gammaproteobacteria bacterium]|nr:MAG: hypothetical protein Ct9H300mP8_07570 [Gammaproteobacteria bacterium]
MKFGYFGVVIPVFGGVAVVNGIKTDGNADDNGGHGKCIEERREEGGNETKKK